MKQIRAPDLTLDRKTVVDLKYTRADWSINDWGTKPGKGNGNLQREDYNSINRQTNPKAQNLRLDPNSCGCRQRGARQEWVPETVPASVSETDLYLQADTFGAPARAPESLNRETPVTSESPARSGAPARAPGSLRPGLSPLRPSSPLLRPLPSSREYKDRIAPVQLRAERLLALQPRSFRWRESMEQDIGYIAEEVREVIPELWREQGGVKGYDLDKLPFYIVELLKAQQRQIDELRATVEELVRRAGAPTEDGGGGLP